MSLHPDPSHVLAQLDSRIEARHLLKHPFYQAWSAGTLSREALRDYAAQYYKHVAAFPTYLSAVHAQTEDMETRRLILQNLIEEEAGSPNHPELWMRFAESLGLTREEVESAQTEPETRALIAEFRRLASSLGTAAGLAALYAYESQIPAVSEKKIEGLRSFYNFTDEDGYRYFTVHIEADREHSRIERELLQTHLTAANSATALAAADSVLEALWQLLSGVCRRHAICCSN
ncbi:MAG TPA: CADD family putative folate metabolism protein [Bryobacteraceae bacterium]|jgi:pyrroloquinoline-quinone synthase|nr:CADD family putative folate metabolism protein [Bryobacteraceae bacterium]